MLRLFSGKASSGSSDQAAPLITLRETRQKLPFVSKSHLLTPFPQSDEWAGLNVAQETRENTRKHEKSVFSADNSSHPVVLL